MHIRHSIRFRILFGFVLSLTVIFISLLCYANLKMRPDSMRAVQRQGTMLAESKASEVGMWIYRKISEFRVLAEAPAFKSADVRGITPLIHNLTESFKDGGDTMETFAYGGANVYSGFNWVNAEAILDLILYEDYNRVLKDSAECNIGDPILSRENKEVLLFYYPITGYGGAIDGMLCSAVPLVRLKEIVNTIRIYDGKTWVMDSDGHIFTTSESYFHRRVLDDGQIQSLLSACDMTQPGSVPAMNVDGRVSTLFYAPVPHSPDWIFCGLVDNSEIYRHVDGMVFELTVVCLLLLIASACMAIVLARSVVKPMRQLQARMDLVERGNLEAYYQPSTKDEICYLGRSYNSMLDRINKLIARIYEEQASKRKAELQVMQAQIKPHFLYNTLDNIKWMAKEHSAEDIAKTVTSLSTFCRVFLSEGKEEIPLYQEFRHTASYLDIQQMRYAQLLTYEIELDDGVRDCPVIKIIVQPLVENAIYHGIKHKKQGGHIRVSAWGEDTNIYICVEDNGVGMRENALAALRASLRESRADGNYGLHNICERLKLAYENQARLTLESVYGEGTKVTVMIPRRQECTELL